MAKRRPKHQIEEFENSKEIYTPCGFCCTMMQIPKELIEKGGLWRCKKCGYGIVFKPHKIKVAKTEREHKYRDRSLYGQQSIFD